MTVPSGRWRTTPVIRTTYSLRTSTSLSTTHWMMPEWSRRSTNARCSPCSRRRPTQPQTLTVWPMFDGRRLPHRSVRIEVGCGAVVAASFMLCRHRESVPVGLWMSEKVIKSSPVDRDLVGVGAQRLHDDGAGGEFVVADDHGVVRAAAVGELHLRLHRAVVVAAVGGEPGVAECGGEHGRLAAADHVDDERVERTLDRRRTRPRRRRRAACGRARGRSRRRASPARRAPRRDRRSGRRHRGRSAPSRACRPGTRRSCGGSSRDRGPASVRR